MTNDPESGSEVSEGEYNPSGDIPSHPADPKYGEGEDVEDAPATDEDEAE